jgi:CDP-glucose 4,6-dehydratase
MGRKDFWLRKRVFLTGHTGFKGSWLSIWLNSLGAEVTGYALPPPTNPSLFDLARVSDLLTSNLGDIRDLDLVREKIKLVKPEIVIHMAAQPIVRDSYRLPVETYAVNVMGTVNLLVAVRHCPGVRAVVNVTTDKCYENREWVWGYRENEPMGGYDPYSNSKACSELVTASYRDSFFNPLDFHQHGVALASARSGNVIGGGDWAVDRLVPDCIRSLLKGEKVRIRNPQATRPWQHVLEPLAGYLLLAQKLYEEGPDFAEAWNFGPEDTDARPVEWIVKRICTRWGEGAAYEIDPGDHPHEANYLKLDCSKARARLDWRPRWNLEEAVDRVLEWIRAFRRGEDLQEVCCRQVREHEKDGFSF